MPPRAVARPDPRVARLNRVFDGVLSGKEKTLSARMGPLFLEAICEQPDRATCVNKLIAAKIGLDSLQAAMWMDLSISFANGLATSVLTYFQASELLTIGGGTFLQKVVTAIVEPPIFWTMFLDAFRCGQLQEGAQHAFAWLLLQLISLPHEQADAYRELAQDPDILARLADAPRPDTKALVEKIKSIMATFDSTAPPLDDEDEVDRPGGRHDNDFVDFRDICILPTADEIQCAERPFLRTADVLEDPWTEDNRVAIYLDHLFRLGREDMICDMREELSIALGRKNGRRRAFHVDGMQPRGIVCPGTDKRRAKWAISFELDKDIPQFKGKRKPEDRRKILSGDNKLLRHQSLTCLLVDNEVIAFPKVHRDDDLLSKLPPIVLLQFEGEASVIRTLQRLKTATPPARIRLVQIDTPIFAYEPILNVLQLRTEVSLKDELLLWDDDCVPPVPSTMPAHIVDALRRDPRQDLRGLLQIQQSKPICLDKSQVSSVLASLTQRVSLIQGPPGTGKSFIGALLAKALHDTTSDIILVVCYTNHALDQFLDDLINIGIPMDNIVRIGGKANAQMDQLTLQKQNHNFRLNRADWQEIDAYKATTDFTRSELDKDFQKYLSAPPVPDITTLMTYLEFEAPRYFDAFHVPEAADGMIQVGRRGRTVDQYYLLRQWLMGKDAGTFKTAPNVLEAHDIWAMDGVQRKSAVDVWVQELAKEKVDAIWQLGKAFNEAAQKLERKFNQHVGLILRNKRIIGCTTTGAAKYTEDIASASPGILLVEEAGEILESHVVTALGSNTKQLILIGDHKQLRPKVNNYLLTVEKGAGYDLNVSLFERLILKGYPHETLSQQHRMRPEISALIRELTYPELVDADSTKNRPDVRGLQDNIVFLNHAHPEDEVQDVVDRRDKTATSSKQNSYEGDMVLKIVRYLGQQGYGTDKLVVLTPYLAQLHLLRDKLRNETDPVLNDLDSHDLVRAGLIPKATAELMKKPLRLATIDNYQGEESDIVIASLTRSNSSHDIGFMFAPERLNVLLSRARLGLILIGNADTFMHARKGSELWTSLFALLKKHKRVFDGFPVKCERHPTRMDLLKQPHDFDDLVPDGGCLEACGTMLSCGIHACPSKCHQLYDHSKMRCDAITRDTCSKGHPLSWTCHEGRPAVCQKCERETKINDEKQRKAFDAQKKRDDDEREHAAKMAKLDEEIRKHQQKLRDAQLEEERENALRQKKQDAEEARALASRSTRPPTPPASTSLLQSVGEVLGFSSSPSTNTTTNAQGVSAAKPSSSSDYEKTKEAATASSQTRDAVSTSSATPAPAPPVSESEAEWERQKTMDNESNDAIDAIMSMTGLEDVKRQVLRIKSKIEVTKRQGTSIKNERFNIVLLGNPGTGKTTVARQYAKFLTSLQVLPGTAFIETTGSRLASDGVNEAKKMVENAINAGGGAIFIDEAYQLKSENAFQGGQVLDFLLAEMENNVGTLVFILAGYSKQMEKFFEHNPGLTSRVPYRLNFADYNDAELRLMLERMMKKRFNGRMKIEGGYEGLYMRIAVRRLGRGRGREGFGNARALENMLAKITERQAERLSNERKAGQRPDDFLILKEDLIGPDPSKALVESAAWKKLQKMIGLQAVKYSIRNLFDLIETNYRRELAEKEPIQMSLNRVFLGSPGTGKTTVAKFYGQILADLGLLSNGEVVIKNPADFIGSVLGESEKNTKAILASTVGKVLIIDEAYMLYGGGGTGTGNQSEPYRTAVIDTIVAEVQSVPGEDRCVLLLGYKDEIMEMFQNVNPGLSRRFAIENAFPFEDFNDEELLKILELKLKDQNLDATDDAKRVAIELLSRARNRPNFGNGGEVENVLGQAKARYQSRQATLPINERNFDVVFEPQDFDPEYARSAKASTNLQKLFEDVVGCEEIVTKLSAYQETARKMKARGMDPRDQIPTSFVMKGPPGTGKTTTARKLGQVYYDMGFLSTADVVECSASDLVAQYVGQTGPKVQKQMEKALGKVLFVDEAYRLAEGPFAKEAIDELVGALTQPKFLNKVVVILAGYDNDMNHLLAMNAGLSSRFSEEIVFKNMSPERCLEVLKKSLAKKNVRLAELEDPTSRTYRELEALVQQMSKIPSWGNARDVGTLAKQMIAHVYANLLDSDLDAGGILAITGSDAVKCAENMLAGLRARTKNAPQLAFAIPELQQLAARPPAPTATPYSTAKAPPAEREEQKPPPLQSQVPGRDPGVSDAAWERLQRAKKEEQLREQRVQEEQRRLEREVQEAKEREKAEHAQLCELAVAKARDEAEQSELKRKLEEERLRVLAARAERERKEAEQRRQMEEEARRKQQEAQAQQKLRQMGVCPVGYRWIKTQGGYQCAGGSHWVSDSQLGL